MDVVSTLYYSEYGTLLSSVHTCRILKISRYFYCCCYQLCAAIVIQVRPTQYQPP